MSIALATGWPPSEVRNMTAKDIAALEMAAKERNRRQRRR